MGDYTEHFSVVDYPDQIHDYIRSEFLRLKYEQAKLLGMDQSKTNIEQYLRSTEGNVRSLTYPSQQSGLKKYN